MAVLPLILGALPSAHAAVSRVDPGTSVSSLQDTRETWRSAFQKAMNVGASSEMERLVKSNNEEAVEWILETAQGIATQSSELLETRMAALRSAWKAAIGSKFADITYEYYSLLDSIYRDERSKLKNRYDKAYNRYAGNLEKKDQTTFGVLYAEFEGLAGSFAELGDHYSASQSWLMAYSCINEHSRGDKADLYKCCRALKMTMEQRKQVDLQDRAYVQASSSFSSLKAQGYDREGGADGEPGSDAPPVNPVTEGKGLQSMMTFELLEEIDEFERPSYYADELHNLWGRIAFQKKDSETKFSSLGALSPTLKRTGSAEVMVDTDGNGEGDLSVPLRGNVDPIEFEIGTGSEKRKWAVLTKIGTQSDMYQNIQVAMQPTDDQMMIYLAPAASVLGEIDGVGIRVIDENMDGLYGSAPLTWAHDGLTTGMMQPEFDTVVIGDAKRALPWSEYQRLGDKWYRLEPANGGTTLKAFPAELETGKVKVNFKGGKPTWLIVQGMGKFENSYFDLMDKDVELPVGSYKLFCGELRKGKKQQTMKTLILPGKSMESWRVNPKETTAIELGAPFQFDFAFTEDEKSITITGKSICIVGAAGERYERPWNCVPRPTASYRKVGTSKGSKPEKFHTVMSQDEINQANDWAVAWFPGDLELIKKGKSEKSELELEEKKNKLFGKIVSDWKE